MAKVWIGGQPGEVNQEGLVTTGAGQGSDVRRAGGAVLRPVGPQTPAVLSFLRHLHAVGYAGAPRPIGEGVTSDGQEAVTFIPGTSPHPRAWPDHALSTIGALLRGLHDASEGFVPPPASAWKPWFMRDLSGEHPVIGHCDCGPWNIVAQEGVPVAFIDWEFAGPVDATWELAQTTWLNAQLHDDDIAERNELPTAVQRARQARLLLDGYRLSRRERIGLVDKLIAVAVHSAQAEAITAHVNPETTEAVDDSGYPILWAIAWRARSASWMLRHRRLLEQAFI